MRPGGRYTSGIAIRMQGLPTRMVFLASGAHADEQPAAITMNGKLPRGEGCVCRASLGQQSTHHGIIDMDSVGIRS